MHRVKDKIIRVRIWFVTYLNDPHAGIISFYLHFRGNTLRCVRIVLLPHSRHNLIIYVMNDVVQILSFPSILCAERFQREDCSCISFRVQVNLFFYRGRLLQRW